MHSYEDRVLAVELYYRYGKKASMVIRELGYPSIKQLGRWVRFYEETGDLPKGLKSRQRYSQAQKIAAGTLPDAWWLSGVYSASHRLSQ